MIELNRDDVLRVLRERIKEAGSQKVYAHKLGVTEQHLSDILHWKPIGPKVLNELRLEMITTTIYRTRESECEPSGSV